MAYQLVTVFLYAFLVTGPLGDYALTTQGTKVNVMTDDVVTMDNIYLEIADMEFIEMFDEMSMQAIGYDLSPIPSFLENVYNRCIDYDNPITEDVTLTRDTSPYEITGKATSMVEIPVFQDPVYGPVPKQVVKIDYGNVQGVPSEGTGVKSFSIALPLKPCV